MKGEPREKGREIGQSGNCSFIHVLFLVVVVQEALF